MKYKEITHQIIGSAMKVHSVLGNGLEEIIYQRALSIEMKNQGLSFKPEVEMTVFYKGTDVGTQKIDFLIEDQIMVELKVLIKLDDLHLSQTMNYCQAYHLPVGLLINFGSKSLEYKRVYNVHHPENV